MKIIIAQNNCRYLRATAPYLKLNFKCNIKKTNVHISGKVAG